MRVKAVKFLACLIIVLYGCVVYAEKPPVVMMTNLDNLAYAMAGLNSCFKSFEYKKLSTNQASSVHNVFVIADEIVERYAKFYKDEKLSMAYYIGVAKYSEKPETKKQMLDKYGTLCSSKYVNDLTQYVSNAKSKVSAYFKNQGR